MHDKPKEACGVFGVYSPGEDVARITFYGLYALQHRGQESAGIASSDGNRIYLELGMGLVSQVFDEKTLQQLHGHIAIGHTRYSTTGSSTKNNAQPFLVEGLAGQLALAHNGNAINADYLQSELLQKGRHFDSSTDSEVIAQLIAETPGKDWPERIRHVMRRIEGAYCLVMMTKDALIAVRDPLGVRPLCLGKLGEGWVIASESCALDHLGAEFIRDVEPGEIIYIDSSGFSSYQSPDPPSRAFCVFEYVYFARPDSVINGKLTYMARERMGEILAEEHPVDGDIVIGTPDSAIPAAIGYSKQSGIPYSEGLIKNRYVGRTFIQPDQRIRELGVQLKFNPLPEVLRGKRIIVIDDSIVRGTTTSRVVSLLRKAGAKEVHLRICSPPIQNPCFFGVDMATRGELIAAYKSVAEVGECVGADSLGYLSIKGLVEAIGLPQDNFCLACLTGEYPIPVQLEMDKLALELHTVQG
ncbi:MAG: amidophosphoribosyltransferase [Dehalococcoidia bacterium]|nr:amidophosphoribosyltransferase [Dehalococcoidia bacterium]